MTPSEALQHAKSFDLALKMLNDVQRDGSKADARLTAMALVHASIFWMGTHCDPRANYNWLQRICDDMAKKIIEGNAGENSRPL